MADGTRLKVAGPVGSIRNGDAVSFWVAIEYADRKDRTVAHSLEIAQPA
ncbi:hypothetical protein [Mesorhizobium sp. f-mel]